MASRRPKRLPKYLTKDELQRLLNQCSRPIDRMIVVFLYNTGIRVSELVNFRIEDIDFENFSVSIFRGKGAKDRVVTISEEFGNELKKFIKDRKEGILFINTWKKPYTPRAIQKRIKLFAKQAKLPYIHKISPHSLRHTHAVHALQAGVNIISIKKQLGHENLRTTMVYTEISDEIVKKDFEDHKPFKLKKELNQSTLEDIK
jgi:integrase/recombinase XerD